MSSANSSESLREAIKRRLEEAQAGLEQRRKEIDQEMVNLETNQQQFNHAANQIVEQVLQPTLFTFAEQFDNARLERDGAAPQIHGQLTHCPRFPALANLSFSVLPSGTSTEDIVVRYQADILPVFIHFESYSFVIHH